MKGKKIYGALCMPYFGTVSSLLQSVDSHGLWGGLTDGLPSTLGSARSRFERDRTSLRCPPYAALTSVQVLERTRRRDCRMTPHFLMLFKKNLNATKPSEHPPQVEEYLKV